MRTTSRLLILHTLLGAVTILTLSKCSLLFGNVSPPVEKSSRYSIQRIDHESPKLWKLKTHSSDLAQPDWVFDHRTLNTRISVTSSCRPRLESSTRTLRDYRKELLIGFDQHTILNETEVAVNDHRRQMVTTISAIESDVPMKLKITQVLDHECLYDLIYVSRPENFAQHEADFDRFTQQFRLQ